MRHARGIGIALLLILVVGSVPASGSLAGAATSAMAATPTSGATSPAASRLANEWEQVTARIAAERARVAQSRSGALASAQNGVTTLLHAAVGASSKPGDWPMPDGGLGGANSNADETTLTPATFNGLQRTWVQPLAKATGATVMGNLVVNYGAVHGGTGLVATDAATGKTLWTYADNNVNWKSPPTLVGGAVYLVDLEGVKALYAATGKVYWTNAAVAEGSFDNPNNTAPLVFDNLVFVQGDVGAFGQTQVLVALNIYTGAEVWSRALSAAVASSGNVLTTDGHSLFTTCSVGHIYYVACALDPTTGKLLWEADLRSPGNNSGPGWVAMESNGTLLGQDVNWDTFTFSLVAFSTTTHQQLWSAPQESPLAADQTTVYAACSETTICARSLTTGQLLWQDPVVSTEGPATLFFANFQPFGAAVAGGLLYIENISPKPALYVSNSATGALLWWQAEPDLGSLQTETVFTSQPVIAHGRVYLTGLNGLIALAPAALAVNASPVSASTPLYSPGVTVPLTVTVSRNEQPQAGYVVVASVPLSGGPLTTTLAATGAPGQYAGQIPLPSAAQAPDGDYTVTLSATNGTSTGTGATYFGITTPITPSATDWPVYDHDYARTNSNPAATAITAGNVSQLRLAWEAPSAVPYGGSSNSDGLLAAGGLVINNSSGALQVDGLNEATGNTLWSYYSSADEFGTGPDPQFQGGQFWVVGSAADRVDPATGVLQAVAGNVLYLPQSALVGSTLYAGTFPSQGLVAVNTDTGATDWTFRDGAKYPYYLGNLVEADGMVFAVFNPCSANGSCRFDVVAVDAVTGKLLWRDTYTQLPYSAGEYPSMAMDGARLIVAVPDIGYVALDSATGKRLWFDPHGGPSQDWNGSVEAVDASTVLVDYYGTETALSPANGNEIWTESGFSGGVLAGGLDMTVCGDQGTSVCALNESTGHLLWAAGLPTGDYETSIAVVQGYVLVQDNNGDVFAYAPSGQ